MRSQKIDLTKKKEKNWERENPKKKTKKNLEYSSMCTSNSKSKKQRDDTFRKFSMGGGGFTGKLLNLRLWNKIHARLRATLPEFPYWK